MSLKSVLTNSLTRVALILFVSSLCLLPVFSVRPMRLRPIPELTGYAANPSSWLPSGTAQELIKLEMQKAVDEIKLRIEEEDTWFHYKIVLVGGLLIAFLQYIRTSAKDLPSSKQRLEDLFLSPATCSALALACVIALAIDIHIRNNIVVIQQLALWMANFAEPAFLQQPSAFQLLPSSGPHFYAWEQFLRIALPTSAGMHQDDLYGLVFYPHLHFLTWLIYMLYLWIFQQISLTSSESTPEELSHPSLFIGFALVHLTLAIFAWTGHAAPSAFEFRLIPGNSDSWCSGWLNSAYYLIPVLILSAFNLYLMKPWRSWPGNKLSTAGQGSTK